MRTLAEKRERKKNVVLSEKFFFLGWRDMSMLINLEHSLATPAAHEKHLG